MGLKLKPREQEVILETKAEHVNEDFSHMDLVGAIYTEGDLRGSDFSGSDLRAAIFSRAIMPGVNFEDPTCKTAFLDYVSCGIQLPRGRRRGRQLRAIGPRRVRRHRRRFHRGGHRSVPGDPAVRERERDEHVHGVDTRDSLGCDALKRYEGAGKGGKVAVSKGSGIWGGAAKE